MIKDDVCYHVTLDQIDKFNKSIEKLESTVDRDDLLQAAESDSLRSK